MKSFNKLAGDRDWSKTIMKQKLPEPCIRKIKLGKTLSGKSARNDYSDIDI